MSILRRPATEMPAGSLDTPLRTAKSRIFLAVIYFFYFTLLLTIVANDGLKKLIDFPVVLLLIIPYFLLALKSPVTGLGIFIIYHLSQLKSLTPSYGPFLSLSILAEICLLAALAFRFLSRKSPRFPTSIPVLTLVYVGFYIVAGIWRSSLSPKGEGLKSLILLGFLFVCLVAFADSREKITAFLRALVVLELFWFGAAAFHVLRYGSQALALRSSIEEGYLEKVVGVNALAVSALMFLPLLYFLSSLEQSGTWRFLTRLGFWLSLITVVLTFSRNGFINLMVVLSLIFLRPAKSRRVWSYVLIVILIIVLAPSSYWSRIRTTTSLQVESGLQLKISHMQRGLTIIGHNPIFGIGLGKLTWAIHNTILQIAVELGLPLLLVFLALVYLAFRETKRARLLLIWKGEAVWSNLPLMLSFSLVAYLIGGLTISLTQFLPVFIVLGLIVAVRNISPELAMIQEGQGLRIKSSARDSA